MKKYRFIDGVLCYRVVKSEGVSLRDDRDGRDGRDDRDARDGKRKPIEEWRPYSGLCPGCRYPGDEHASNCGKGTK